MGGKTAKSGWNPEICFRTNSALTHVAGHSAKSLPARVEAEMSRIRTCPSCEVPFWKPAHLTEARRPERPSELSPWLGSGRFSGGLLRSRLRRGNGRPPKSANSSLTHPARRFYRTETLPVEMTFSVVWVLFQLLENHRPPLLRWIETDRVSPVPPVRFTSVTVNCMMSLPWTLTSVPLIISTTFALLLNCALCFFRPGGGR